LNAFIPLLSEIGLVTLKRLGRLQLANDGLAQIQLLQAKKGCGLASDGLAQIQLLQAKGRGLASKRLLGC